MAILVDDLDFNQIREKIVKIMGPGTGQFGYGQQIISSTVSEGDLIRKKDWDELRFDILNARIHQDGITPNLVEAVRGEPIKTGESSPKLQYNNNVDVATANKFKIGPGQFVVEAGINQSRNQPWKESVSTVISINFGNANNARWFFNSGGRLRFSSSRVGGQNTFQNNTWSALLSNIGTISFGATNQSPDNSVSQTTSQLNFWQLTNSYILLFEGSQTSPYQYSSNKFRIRVKSNVSNNLNGGAFILDFEVTWFDSYSWVKPGPPLVPDQVDGTLRLIVEELRASGNLLPLGTGSFSISRPTYSILQIIGS